MAFHNNGRKYYHILECFGQRHLYITDGMLFTVDEIKCKKHGIFTAVLERNLNKVDADYRMAKTQ